MFEQMTLDLGGYWQEECYQINMLVARIRMKVGRLIEVGGILRKSDEGFLEGKLKSISDGSKDIGEILSERCKKNDGKTASRTGETGL